MIKKCLNQLKSNWDILLVFVVSFLVFWFINQYVKTDIQLHISHAKNINLGEANYPPNFLYYFLVNMLSFFSGDIMFMNISAITLLVVTSVFKYIISREIILKSSQFVEIHYRDSFFKVISLCLFFSFSIPDFYNVMVLKKMYLGRIVPAVWHNSTVIFLFPFAIALFWKQLKFLKAYKTLPKLSTLLLLHLLVIINVSIKPSFIFVYVPITTLAFVLKLKKIGLKSVLIHISPCITGLVFILLQSIFIYHLQHGSIQQQPSSLGIASPFKVLRMWLPFWYMPISFLISLLYPLCCIYFYREILKYPPFVYSLSMFIFGFLISAFIVESGPRMYHGNFMWQNIIGCYLLILSTTMYLIPKFQGKSKIFKAVFLETIFYLQTVSGIGYLFWIFISRTVV